MVVGGRAMVGGVQLSAGKDARCRCVRRPSRELLRTLLHGGRCGDLNRDEKVLQERMDNFAHILRKEREVDSALRSSRVGPLT